MRLKLIRTRHNGERVVDEEDFENGVEGIKASLDKWIPGVYTSYMVYDMQGNMIASKGLFGADD